MANRKVHQQVGAASGAVFALSRSGAQEPKGVLLETIGGALGGLLFGIAPDVIDPPTHPGHRSLGHGVAPIGAVAVYYFENLGSWQEQLRCLAWNCADAARQAGSESERFQYVLLEKLCRLATGFVAGAGAGYVSHLVLDAATPKRLPLIA